MAPGPQILEALADTLDTANGDELIGLAEMIESLREAHPLFEMGLGEGERAIFRTIDEAAQRYVDSIQPAA